MTQAENRTQIRKSLEIVIPISGLIYFDILSLSTLAIMNFPTSDLVLIPFVVVFALCAYGIARRSRISYIISAVLSATLFALFATTIVEGFGAVTIPYGFFAAVTSVPILLAVIIYSVLGLRRAWRKEIIPKPMRMIPASSVVILVIVGFIIGAMTIGVIAAQTENRLLGSAGAGNITIVQGAGEQNNGQFYSPQTFTVKAGTTVTWINHDGVAHTITSKGSNLFDSGNIPTGGSFTYTYTQPGTYNYYCTVHPWMTGTIVVTSG